MATYCADRVIVFEGEPGVKTIASTPMSLVEGMNKFLKIVDITFRRDPVNNRPRINKLDSNKDKMQKARGDYFSLEVDQDEDNKKDAEELKQIKKTNEEKHKNKK